MRSVAGTPSRRQSRATVSRKAKRSRCTSTTLTSCASRSGAAGVQTMVSPVSSASRTQRPPGSSASPWLGSKVSGTLWVQCLHNCCRYRMALAVSKRAVTLIATLLVVVDADQLTGECVDPDIDVVDRAHDFGG